MLHLTTEGEFHPATLRLDGRAHFSTGIAAAHILAPTSDPSSLFEREGAYVVALVDNQLAARSDKGSGKREALNLRIEPQVRELIDRAAELAGKNCTDLVLYAARRREWSLHVYADGRHSFWA